MIALLAIALQSQTVCYQSGWQTICDTRPTQIVPNYQSVMDRAADLVPDYNEQRRRELEAENLRLRNEILRRKIKPN